jgi:hypothetical protein
MLRMRDIPIVLATSLLTRVKGIIYLNGIEVRNLILL